MLQGQLGRRAKKTREEIYSAAMELFARFGVANVSMQDIADKAETARSTVFNHYPRKQALLSEFFTRLANNVLAAATSNDSIDFHSGMNTLFQAMQDEALKVEPVFREIVGMAVRNGPLANEEAAMDDQLLVLLSDLLNLGIAAGQVHSDTDIGEAAKLILCVITETNHDAISQNRMLHLAEDHQKRLDMLVRGLGKPANSG